MARNTMNQLIGLLRNWTQVTASDYTITAASGTVTYWSDDQLQAVLDRHRTYVRREELECIPELTGGTSYYYDFFSKYRHFELTDGGTAVFLVEDSNGDARSTSTWTANYWDGYIRFTTDQVGMALYLTGRSYDVHQAAAEVWRTKAANVSAYYSFSADGQRLDRSDWYRHATAQAEFHERQASPMMVNLVRTDAPEWGERP